MSNRPDPSTETEADEEPAACPYCGSSNTKREHPKGPALCRSIHFCHECSEQFEAMR